MASEQTPLLKTVVVVQQQERYPHTRIRRFFTAVLFLGLVVVTILFLLPSDVPLGNHHRHHDLDQPWQPIGNPGTLETTGRHLTGNWHVDLRKTILDTPDAEKVAEWSRYYTAGPHLAGKNLSQAEWTRDLWESFGIKSEVVAYETYINYPISSRVALLEEPKKKSSNGSAKVKYECSLEEDVLDEDPTTSLPNRVPVFHGYSASGNVTAQYVYVNFGTYNDFEDLVKAKVPLKGKIAIVKYGRCFRGIKVQLAQLHGMSGVLIYDDPQEDGEITETNGYKAYPDGPARNPSAVQRGSVQYLSTAPGDPTTIGYPSKPGAPRMDPNGTTPQIPSLPISYKDAVPLLKALNGHGPRSEDFNKWWQGGGLGHLGVKYNIGPSPPELKINLFNDVEYVITPLWNTIGIINGTGLADQTVVVGNHRDAWIIGGAADPNSGSAALNEIVRSFGKALDGGWKPQRNLVFASWDGEEYGLLGSTEWVEEYVPWLNAEAVSYLNVDVASAGPIFDGSASPLLNHALKFASSQVPSPNQTVKGQTVYSVWSDTNDARISTLGSGSDYTAFLDFAGVSSVNVGFVPDKKGGAVYHYHSNYDSFHWMSKFGDPGFKYHVAIAQLLGALAVDMVDTPVLPYFASDYAESLTSYIAAAEKKLKETPTDIDGALRDGGFPRLRKAAQSVSEAASALDTKAARLMHEIENTPFWWRWLHGRYLRRQAARINTALKLFERSFLYDGGLDGRPWFKHVVFAPGKWTGYAGATLPGLLESIDARDWPSLARWEIVVANCLAKAQKALEDGL